MSVSDTVLIFIGIPAAVALIITVLVRAGGAGSPRRYRPGRPFDFAPVWFLSSPEQVAEASGKAALPGGGQRAALTPGEVETKAAPTRPGATGGASDRW